MAKCDNCLRVNAPTRSTCLYCGAGLSIVSETASLQLPLFVRSLETGQSGFNLVLASGQSPPEIDDAQHSELADLLHLESSQLHAIWQASIGGGRKLPLARAPLPDEAASLAEHLAQMGVVVEIIPDKILSAESLPPKRMRFFEFTERSLTGRTLSEAEEERLEWADIILIVVGRIFVRQVEVEERRARRP
ncbi:MAG: hypothetical protein WKF84_11470 [Pyrinomonadaceae bacterium]